MLQIATDISGNDNGDYTYFEKGLEYDKCEGYNYIKRQNLRNCFHGTGQAQPQKSSLHNMHRLLGGCYIDFFDA